MAASKTPMQSVSAFYHSSPWVTGWLVPLLTLNYIRRRFAPLEPPYLRPLAHIPSMPTAPSSTRTFGDHSGICCSAACIEMKCPQHGPHRPPHRATADSHASKVCIHMKRPDPWWVAQTTSGTSAHLSTHPHPAGLAASACAVHYTWQEGQPLVSSRAPKVLFHSEKGGKPGCSSIPLQVSVPSS